MAIAAVPAWQFGERQGAGPVVGLALRRMGCRIAKRAWCHQGVTAVASFVVPRTITKELPE
jgi:hypothetical protein